MRQQLTRGEASKLRRIALVRLCVPVLLGILLCGPAGHAPVVWAQRPEPGQASQGTALLARVYYTDRASLERLARELDVWEVQPTEGYLLAMLTPLQALSLARAGLRLQVDLAGTAGLSRPRLPLPDQMSGIPAYPCYRTVEETYAVLSRLARQHPNLASWEDIGDSWDRLAPGGPDGYDLFALVVTNRASVVGKHRLFVVAETHAREYATAELAARFAEYLVESYGSDPEVTWLLDYAEVRVLPLANPDGRKLAETGSYWRKNTDSANGCDALYGTDLNRNYDFSWGGGSGDPCAETYQGPSAASEPETQAIQRYVTSTQGLTGPLTGAAPTRGARNQQPTSRNPRSLPTGLLLTFHSYGSLVLYPWGWSDAPPPDEIALRTLGRKFGFYNGYSVRQAVALYPTTGTTDDWAYGALGLAAYTFELGSAFFEDCGTFASETLPRNLPALLYAAKAAHRPFESPSGPETLQISLSPTAVLAGQPLTLTALADDSRYWRDGLDDETAQPIAAARYTIDSPSWVSGAVTRSLGVSDGQWDAPQERLQATLPTASLTPGRHVLLVESQDAAGHWGVPSAAFFWILPEARAFLPLVGRR